MLLLYMISAFIFSRTTLAQANLLTLISEVPSCTEKCALSEITFAGCKLNNLTGCICTNSTLQLRLSTCVLNSCNLTEQTRSSTILQQLCKGIPQPSRVGETVRISVILTVLATFAVALRCASRCLVARKFWWDDWVILFVAVLLIPLSVFGVLNPRYGFGKHIWNIPPMNAILLRKMYYTVQIFYVFVISLAKVSVLCFYLRVIPGDRFARITKICIIWMACHFLGFLMAVVLECLPISALWDTDLKGRCVNSQALGFAGAGVGIFEDVVIILLPISELRTLTLDWKKKAVLIIMFALGSFVFIASIIRFRFIVSYNSTSPDATWEQVDIIIWSEIEAYVATICGCLITLRALLLKLFPGLFAVNRVRAPRDDSTLPSWRVRRSSKLAANLGYANNIVELSSIDDAQVEQKVEQDTEQKVESRAEARTKESLEIEEIMA